MSLSAEDLPALEAQTRALVVWLRSNPGVDLGALACAAARAGRRGACRRVVLACSADGAARALERQDPNWVWTGAASPSPRGVVFMFPGIGDQYVGMGRELYETEPVFRDYVDRGAEYLHPHLGLDLRTVLYPPTLPRANAAQEEDAAATAASDFRRMLARGATHNEDESQAIYDTVLNQPAMFVIEYALAQTFLSWSIRPCAMIGYSLGEYVAACLAGIFTWEDALGLIVRRAQRIEELAPGGMLAVPLPEVKARALLGAELDIAAITGANMCVVAGPKPELDQLEARLLDQGIASRRIQSSRPFHSRRMEAIAEPLRSSAAAVARSHPVIPIASNVTGQWITGPEATDPAYWTRHLCQTVRFADGLSTAWKARTTQIMLEVGPGEALTSLAILQLGPDAALSSMRAGRDAKSDGAVVLRAVARLWSMGVEVDWQAVYPSPAEGLAWPLRSPESASNGHESAPTAAAAPPSPEMGAPASSGTHVQRALIDIWKDLLRVSDVGLNARFSDLGGNSLLASQMVLRMRQALGVAVPLRTVFRSPTIQELAAHVEALRATGSSTPLASAPIPARTHHPLDEPYVLPNGCELYQLNRNETNQFYSDIFEHQAYTRHGIRLPDHACVFDVGANIGMFTLFVHQSCKQPTVYAFEPAPPMFEILQANAKLHRWNVHLFQNGISDETKVATLTFYPRSSGMSSFHADKREEQDVLRSIIENQVRSGQSELAGLLDQSGEFLEVRFEAEPFTCRLRTLSEMIQETRVRRIDLLKIDVQKCELEVLNGIQPKDWDRIDQIAVEVHDIDGRVAATRSVLEARGFRVTSEQDDLYRGSNIYNLYAVRK